MQNYQIINEFSDHQKNLLKRRFKAYKEENGYTYPKIVDQLNVIYWNSEKLRGYVDNELQNRKEKRKDTKSIDLDEKDIVSKGQLQKISGNTDRITGIEESNFPEEAELNVIGQLLFNKKYLSNAQLRFVEDVDFGVAYTLAEYFNNVLDNEFSGDLKGNYILYEINDHRIKQQVLSIALSRNNQFFVMTSIISTFDNHNGLKDGKDFRLKNYERHCNSLKVQTGWVTNIPESMLLCFLKDWNNLQSHKCSLLTDINTKNNKDNSIRIQDIPAVNNNVSESRSPFEIKEYHSCSQDEFDLTGTFIKDEYKDLYDKIAEFNKSRRSALPKIDESQDEVAIKKPYSQTNLTIIRGGLSEKEKIMNDQLGEKFVQAVYDYEREVYLDCIKQGVDVDYQSKKTGMAAIHAAAESGNAHAIEILRDEVGADFLVLSGGGSWLPSDIAALVQNHALADILSMEEHKQMKERGITREDLIAEATRIIEEQTAPFDNSETPSDDNMPTNG